jgi:hypothetical protein
MTALAEGARADDVDISCSRTSLPDFYGVGDIMRSPSNAKKPASALT